MAPPLRTLRERPGSPGEKLYQLPPQSGASPLQGKSGEEVEEWLRQSVPADEVYPVLRNDEEHLRTVARHASREQLSEEVLWVLLEEGMGQVLCLNPAYSEDHLALLMEGVRADLGCLQQSWREHPGGREVEGMEPVKRRLMWFGEHVQTSGVPNMAEGRAELAHLVESLSRPAAEEKGMLGWSEGLTRSLLKQEAIALSEEQLAALGSTYPHTVVLETVIRRARTGGPALAIYEAIRERGDRHLDSWTREVTKSEAALSSPGVRRVARQFAQGKERLAIWIADLQDASALEYPGEIRRLWQESRRAALQAIAKYPPPEGTVLPRELMAEMLSAGEAEARMALIRLLGTTEVAYTLTRPAGDRVRTSQPDPESPSARGAPRRGR